MKSIIKFIGIIVVLVGVIILAYHHFIAQTNTMLGLGGLFLILGFFLHIYLNKKYQD